MLSSDPSTKPQDKAFKKNPFSSWIKRLKGSSGSKRSKKTRNCSPSNPDKAPLVNEPGIDTTPQPQRIPSNHNIQSGFGQNAPLDNRSLDETPNQHLESSNRSAAGTLVTNPETVNSDAGQSKSGATTVGGGMSSHSGGGNSIFSSSNHSSHSLATTLTTIQSTAPSTALQNATVNGGPAGSAESGHQHNVSQGSTYFSHQYPTTPASAVPPHVVQPTPSHLPTTYRSATANNLLTDNASILTLASSTHVRRNSADTAASVRAIPPSSQWGGSRESLPLSVLSQTTELSGATAAGPSAPSAHQMAQRQSTGGMTAAERASIYSGQGVSAPALSSERNSVYAGRTGGVSGADGSSIKQTDGGSIKASVKDADASSLKASDGLSLRTGDAASLRADGGSVRSGFMGHGRNDSLAGSIGPSPLVSPLELVQGSE